MRHVVLALCLLLSGSLVRADEPAPAAPLKVPFELLPTQHMVVKVKINGKGPYRLIFDTGAPVTLINNKLAKEAGVIPKGYRAPLFSPFGSVGQFTIKGLELGGVRADDLPTVVMDHPTVTLMAKYMGPLEGIVGFSFFGRYRTSIDYQAKELTFVPTGFRPPDVMKKMMDGLTAAGQKAERQVLQPAGLWGFRVHNADGDAGDGVDVQSVAPGSPADQAGLKAGDRLLVLDDRWTDSVVDCYAAAAGVPPGTDAVATVRRDGKELALKVRVRPGL